MFTTALFIIAPKQKQPKCPSNYEINKMLYNHTMGYYSAINRNEVLTHAITWANLEDIMLSIMSERARHERPHTV